MPVIRTYQAQIAPGGGIDTPQASPAAFGAGVAVALDNLQTTLLRQREVERARQREEAAVQTGVQLAEFDLATADAATRLRETAPADGTGHREAALTDYDARAATLLDGITDPEVRGRAQVQIAQGRTRLATGEGEFEAKRRVDNMFGGVKKSTDIYRAALFTKPVEQDLIVAMQRQDDVISALNAPDALKEQYRTEVRKDLTLSYAKGLAEFAPYELRDKIRGGFFNNILTDDDLGPLHNRADTEIRTRETIARAEARAAEAERRAAEAAARAQAAAVVDDTRAAIAAGIPVPQAAINQAANLAGQLGRPGAQMTIVTMGVRNLVNTNYAKFSPVQLQNHANALSAEIAKAGENANPAMIAERDQTLTLLDKQRTALRNDPLSWATRAGVVAATPLNPADPASFTKRWQDTRAAAQHFGSQPMPLTLPEVESMAELWNTGSPKQRAAALLQLRQFGQDGAIAAARQIAPRDPAAAHVLSLSFLPGGGGQQNVGDYFTGNELRTANPKLVPQAAVNVEIDSELGDALRYAPPLKAVVPAVAANLTAARISRQGMAYSRAALKGGLQSALGGQIGSDGIMRGGLGLDNQGGTVVLPKGVSQDDFNTALEKIDDAALARNPAAAPVDPRGKPYPAVEIKNGRLFAVGDGRYYVHGRDGKPIGAANGELFVLRIGPRR
jgi:hypothetical protein